MGSHGGVFLLCECPQMGKILCESTEESVMKKIVFSLMVAFWMIGCGSDFPMAGDQPVSDGAPVAGVPAGASEKVPTGMDRSPTTMISCRLEPTLELELLRKSWAEAERQFQGCEEPLRVQKTLCEEGEETSERCDAFYRADSLCMYRRDVAINRVSQILCGASIIRMNGVVDPELYHDRLGVDVGDADGDGINNYWEYVRGFDPCSIRSFQHCPEDSKLEQ